MEKKKKLNGKEGKKFFIFLADVVVSMKKGQMMMEMW